MGFRMAGESKLVFYLFMPGGRRKGSKAAHTLEAEKYREILIRKIVEKAEPLANALIEKGLGGDVSALKEINERSLGKVRESLDITTKGKALSPTPEQRERFAKRHGETVD